MAAREGSSSFLKKRTKRLLIFRKRTGPGYGRIAGRCGKSKSLLVLFFRKELLSFCLPIFFDEHALVDSWNGGLKKATLRRCGVI
jgi:hypothetical protein